MASIPHPKIRTSDHTHFSFSSDFVAGTKIAITWYSNYSHSSRSSSSQIPHVAILVHDELVMKSYMHVQLAIVETLPQS
jgi:hypothetical protein